MAPSSRAHKTPPPLLNARPSPQLQQKAAQTPFETKKSTARAQQSIFSCAAQTKTAKAQQETPKAKFHQTAAEAQRETNNLFITARAQQNFPPATSQTKTYNNQTKVTQAQRLTKNNNHTNSTPWEKKSCASTTGNKTINRASSTKHFTSHHPSNKTMKAQQETPKAQLQQKAAQARREIK